MNNDIVIPAFHDIAAMSWPGLQRGRLRLRNEIRLLAVTRWEVDLPLMKCSQR